MNTLARLGVIGAFCALSATALGAQISLNNQGFESGLQDWSSIGDVQATTGIPVSITTYAPFPDGTTWDVYPYQKRMAQLVSNNGLPCDECFLPNIPALDSFFNLPAGTINALIPQAYNGSGIKQSFVGNKGDVLTQYWNFFSTEDRSYTYPDGSHPNDTAFVVITRVDGPNTSVLLANTLASTQSVGDPGHTGWNSFAYLLPDDGDYTIGFGVANWRDEYFDAVLFVDDGSTPAPEPASLALLALALTGLGWSRHRKS